MLVYVKPIEEEKWHGKKGSDTFARPFVLEVLVDGETLRYATGLSEEDEAKYSALLGQDLSATYRNEPHPYWSTKPAFINLPYSTSVFNTERPADYVKVQNLKASKYIANSLKEYEDGLFPDAKFIIYDEQEETDVKASKIQLKNKATEVAMKMSADEKANIVRILSDKSVRGRSANFIDVELDDIINNKTDDFIKYAKQDSTQVYIRASLLEALDRHILTKEGNSILYMGDKIGYDLEDAIKYFSDPNNQALKAAVLSKLTSK